MYASAAVPKHGTKETETVSGLGRFGSRPVSLFPMLG